MRFVFPPVRRSRNPLVRALTLVAGLAAVGVLLVFGVVVLGVLFVGAMVILALRQWRLARGQAPGAVTGQAPPARPVQQDPNVLEGEFVVLQQNRPVHH